MALRIMDALFLGGYKIEIKFSAGKTEVVDLEEDIRYTPGFEFLKHPAIFRNFRVNSSGFLVWDNGAINLSPEYLLNRVTPKELMGSGLAPSDHDYSYQPV